MTEPPVTGIYGELQRKIEALWARQRPGVYVRLGRLEGLAHAELPLSPEDRKEAVRIAHNFAGSLGMFGFHQSSRIALELEGEFERQAPRRAKLQELTAALRASLD